MRRILCPLVLLTAFAIPIAAHADTIYDVVLKGGGHTIAYTLPATSSFPFFSAGGPPFA